MIKTRRTILGLLGAIATPRIVRAANLPVAYDLIPVAGRSDLAINYNSPTWNNVAYQSGQTCLTCHEQVLRGGPYQQAQDVAIRMCLGGSGYVRLASYYYDVNGHPVFDYSWAPPFQCRNGYGVDNQAVEIANHFNAAIGPSTPEQIFTVECLGVGSLYMARLEINWAV